MLLEITYKRPQDIVRITHDIVQSIGIDFTHQLDDGTYSCLKHFIDKFNKTHKNIKFNTYYNNIVDCADKTYYIPYTISPEHVHVTFYFIRRPREYFLSTIVSNFFKCNNMIRDVKIDNYIVSIKKEKYND